jgi:serine/threonine-protein kinase
VISSLVVLSRDPRVRAAAAASKRPNVAVDDADELVGVVKTRRPRVIILDHEHVAASEGLRRLAAAPGRDQTVIILVTREGQSDPPTGAHVVVCAPGLPHVLSLIDRSEVGDARRPIKLDQLLALSVLTGPLEHLLDAAADHVAVGFGADRCLISVRGDSTGGAAVGAHTWDSLAWSRTAGRCRAAAASRATFVAPAAVEGGAAESYLAVPLATPLGSHGFIGLVVDRARIFPREDRIALQAVAFRLGAELGWRAVHERTVEELDRLVNGPGLDPLLGIWNRHAMQQLATMQVSASRRIREPLAVIVVDVVDLATLNTRYGLETGDRLLRRIADALRALLRIEDIVGRWSGDKMLILLPATPLDGAQRVSERLLTAFAARSLELPNGATLAIPATLGVAALQANEDPDKLILRAVWAAARAQQDGHEIMCASTGPAPRLSQSLEPGEELRANLGGTYRLLHEISRGGMGVVYRALDLALERPVAIKMLRPDLAENHGFVETLRREAALLAGLQHPNLVQIYTFGQLGGDSYFVMELVEGEGLQQAIERHRAESTKLPRVEVLAVINQVASALDALHDCGVIHRDVKPANIIRDPFRNRSVLVDVGIARRYGQFAESAGTPGFVAPEVIVGGEATPASDVYGLAATAYMLLTLASPWGDDEHLLGRQVGDEAIPPVSSLDGSLAAADGILAAGLSHDPSRRPPSAGAFARALAAALATPMPVPKDDARWAGNVVMPSRARRSAANTRGVVFRSVARALGVREAQKLRDAINSEHADLALALTDTAPLAWLPTELFTRFLSIAPAHVGRDSARLAHDVARATLRASFRRFFPASAATLVPERTLSAIRNVWSQYQSWGAVSCMPVSSGEMVIRIAETPRDHDLCAWTSGMLGQLVVLSGGRTPNVDHEACEARGDRVCLYRVMWQRAAEA